MRRLLIPFLLVLIGTATLWQGPAETGLPAPVQGQTQTQTQIQARGNLPAAASGYYREYTVPMPVEESAP
jgi:hypothetical protein